MVIKMIAVHRKQTTFTWLCYVVSRYFELRRLEKVIRTNKRPNLPMLEQVSSNKAVWRIAVPNQEPCFMSFAHEAGSFIVHLDAERFYYAWLKSSPAMKTPESCECVCRADMPNDYKFHYAVDGFSYGVSNPVPLALAGVLHDSNGQVHLGFTNGITRTFWLLANHCPAFPVQVRDSDSAELLHQIAGLDGGLISSNDLFAKNEVTRIVQES